MKGRYMIEDPRKVKCELKITGSVEEFEELRDQLKSEWPSSELKKMITSILIHVRKVFYGEHDASEGG